MRAMTKPMKVIYNADCPICAREIAHYRKRAHSGEAAVEFLPLCDAPEFGLTEDQAARRLHVVNGETILNGADAFIAMWSRVPGYQWLARLVGQPFLHGAAHRIYEQVLAPTLYALHRRRVRRTARRP